jgi:predicted TIM-barrel fold metal-dependent hydrolase
MNANFRPGDMRSLYWDSVTRALWGSSRARTHTVPNLLAEMDASRVGRSVLLPMDFGALSRADLTLEWMRAVDQAGARDRFIMGASVYPGDEDAVEKLEDYARRGARIVKLHPPMQRFYPDAPEVMPIYEACDRLGLPVFFHGGRAGIEPDRMHPYALMRHYEGAFREFPKLQFVLGHGGARDVADAIPLAKRYPNVWLGTHGQGVTSLRTLIAEVGGDRLLFGTDWPFYHQCSSLAKVLLATQNDAGVRRAILRDNSERLLPEA